MLLWQMGSCLIKCPETPGNRSVFLGRSMNRRHFIKNLESYHLFRCNSFFPVLYFIRRLAAGSFSLDGGLLSRFAKIDHCGGPMKLKTRLIIAFFVVILVPFFLFALAFFGFSRYQVRLIEESYRLRGTRSAFWTGVILKS